MASILQLLGAPPQKQPRYVPMFMDRSFTGLFTQRAVVHDPADIYTSKYYGGRPDALWAGANIELTNRLTLQRRPGLSTFNTTGGAGFTYPTQPTSAYSFQLTNGTIQVIIDTTNTGPSEQDSITSVATSVAGLAIYTGSFASGANNGLQGQTVTVAGFVNGSNNGVFNVFQSTATTLTLVNANAVSETHAATATTIFLTSVVGSSSGSTVYTGVITNGGANAFAGLTFQVTGFQNGVNNGTFVCTASTTTTLTLTTPNITTITETPATAQAVSAGAVYWDQQNGSASLLFSKSPGAGQTYFIGSGGILYFGNGVDIKKYTPLNTNPGGPVWNWGIAPPTTQPTVTIVSAGSASTVWQANTVFSTMGIVYDSANHQLWQLISVNADPANPNSTQFGTSGTGQPNWSQVLWGTTPDTTGGGTITNWYNISQILPWSASTIYGDAGGPGATNTPANTMVYDPISNAIYGNFIGAGGLSRTGTVKPPFTASPGWNYNEGGNSGGTVGGVTYNQPHWFFIGTIAQAKKWLASHSYKNWWGAGGTTSTQPIDITQAVIEPFILPPPTVGVNGQPPTKVYFQVPGPTGGTSGSGYTPFPGNPSSIGQQQADGQLLWQCISATNNGGGNVLTSVWQANYQYTPWAVAGSTFSCVFDGTNIQVCKSVIGNAHSGTVSPGSVIASAASMTITANTPAVGQATITLGAGSWTHTPNTGDSIGTSGFTNSGNNSPFPGFIVVSATSNTIVIAATNITTETHSATVTLNPWGTSYGNTIRDNNVTWVCVGPPLTWASATIYHLPKDGFAPPSQTQAFGGSQILAANNNTVQAVTVSGKSGAGPAAPTFNGVGANTTDNTITWFGVAVAVSNSLAFKLGYSYGFSYKARALNDLYAPPPLGGIGGTQQFPPGLTNTQKAPFINIPVGSQTNAVSSCSPVNVQTGANSGAVITVAGPYSPDPQCDTIIIWRSADGGGPAQMFELTEIPNIPGNSVGWSFQDFLPDLASGSFPGLNTLIPAPIGGVNNQPFSTYLPMAYNLQRIFGAQGQFVPFSAGPDIKVGNPDEAFPAVDALPFLAPVVRIVKSPQGLLTFLTDSIEVIIGGPATSTLGSVSWAPGVGLGSFNALDVFAGEFYFFSADNQFRVMTPSLNITNAGFPIGDQFANQPSSGTMSSGLNMTWDPKQVYVASHQSGTDSAIFVGDGNTGWYRLNPRQAGGMPNSEPVWSPYAIITNGCQMVQSVEVTPGVKKLLVGPQVQHSQILKRDLTVFTDNGTQYDAFFEMGNITLAHPGQMAVLKFCEFDFSGSNFKPTVSYLLNEISGQFTNFSSSVFDPPTVYGDTLAPTSYSPNRYYFKQNASLARCRHLRLKVDYGTTSNGDEMYNATIYGRLMVEV